ncbi:MAG: 4'-phosphopantetheinyl transferase superfamily protein [Oscillospiraceae bacterium]|nr:4'-phosphopantetheinyl transferase superfamily protein [Oscillospiraceae bacterium]
MELQWYDILQPDGVPAPDWMDSERRRRAESMRHEADRLRTEAGEYLARRMLAQRMDCAMEAVPLRWDEAGKPFVEGGAWHVSISHSGAYAVCAVDRRPVGVDLETVRTVDEKFMRRVCTEAELSYLAGGDGSPERFWELWTAKEAVFKLTGAGPLLRLSKLALPERISVCYMRCRGCALTVAWNNREEAQE